MFTKFDPKTPKNRGKGERDRPPDLVPGLGPDSANAAEPAVTGVDLVSTLDGRLQYVYVGLPDPTGITGDNERDKQLMAVLDASVLAVARRFGAGPGLGGQSREPWHRLRERQERSTPSGPGKHNNRARHLGGGRRPLTA